MTNKQKEVTILVNVCFFVAPAKLSALQLDSAN